MHSSVTIKLWRAAVINPRGISNFAIIIIIIFHLLVNLQDEGSTCKMDSRNLSVVRWLDGEADKFLANEKISSYRFIVSGFNLGVFSGKKGLQLHLHI